jgi:branched-chain amino acid transport system ATP-binding protein
MFAADGLSVEFGAVKALQEVTMQCSTGVVGIAGANGAGKSTVLNVFCGYISPTSGRISLRGKDCTGVAPLGMYRLKVGRVAQHPELSGALTPWENVSMGLPRPRAAKRLRGLIDDLGLAAWMKRDVTELPYSAQKLLDLVRAMAADPDVLLCDEPFSGLDVQERDRTQEVLSSVARSGKMLLIVEHDVIRLASMVDQLVILENGRKLADGVPKEVLERKEVIASFIGESSASTGSLSGMASW